jgi:signal transduction histidine kinase/ActR/RegA family two-component response regulator
MAGDADANVRAPIALSFTTNFGIALATLLLGSVAILRYHDDPALHTVLDTSVATTSALIALLIWDISRRHDRSGWLFLAITFATLAMGELAHVFGVLGWLGSGPLSDLQLRAGTWGPPAYLLPIGIGAALLLRERPRSFGWVFAAGLMLVAIVLVAILLSVPRYSAPGLLWVTRPTLLLVPVLWMAVGVGYWRVRRESEMARAIALTAVILVLAHGAMTYSHAPSDAMALVAHLGKLVGAGLLLFNLTQIGAADTSRREQAEQQLTALNRDLDARVSERTVRLRESNERLHLLEQITRAIGQRQDASSIFQVVVRTLEDRLPADFVCISRYDRVSEMLTVEHVGVGSAPLGHELGITERAEIAIDGNGLSRCVAGDLVYEPDIAEVDFPFPSRLARQGLRSLVVVPISFEGAVFGVLVVSRRKERDFLSTDCEFLRQLGEHVGLAAHQTQLRDSLQQAYDDIKQTQQAVLEQERLRAIGQMASGIAHDINNAISPVAIYTQSLLEREPDLPPTIRDYLELVGRVVKDIAVTVARLRDFYRADDDGAELELVNLNDLVPQVVELTRARWSDMPQQRGVVIRVSSELEADVSPVMANASELREAMTNLIFNAVDAMPQGGAITIRTATLAGGAGDAPQVRLEIGDTGAGMDDETRRRCLEAFFTTKGDRGTGLGLAMVQSAAQRHKAALDIDSAPGAGTRIRLDFAAATAARAGKTSSRGLRATRPLRLLLIDDDPAVLNSTMVVLRLSGHTIAAADGGQAGIDALRAALAAGERFDAIITDLGMPYVDGNTVALAAKEMFPDTPVVLLTGWGRRMATGGQAPAHVDFVLPKPLDLDELRTIFAHLPDPQPAQPPV